MSEVEITTDGSCLGNPGPGGWACILRCGQHERVLQGGVADTTNNRMELFAAIEGLRALKRASRVTRRNTASIEIRWAHLRIARLSSSLPLPWRNRIACDVTNSHCGKRCATSREPSIWAVPTRAQR